MRCKPKHTKLDDLIYDRCKECICQARLSDRDSRIAELYLLERMPQIEIAATLNITRGTISRNLPQIVSSIENAAKNMGYI